MLSNGEAQLTWHPSLEPTTHEFPKLPGQCRGEIGFADDIVQFVSLSNLHNHFLRRHALLHGRHDCTDDL